MKNKKNFTFYGLVILGAVLTVPIAFIILNNFSDRSDVFKASCITGVFVLLSAVIILIYKYIFDVPMEVITQDKTVTELDRKRYWLLGYKKKQQFTTGIMKRLLKDIDQVMEQIEIFNRRKAVFGSLLGDMQEEQGGAIADMAVLVEEALDYNTDKIIDRIKIFDDKLQVFIVEQNLEYMEEYIGKNNQALMEFEKLITEISGMGDSTREVDISRLSDIIHAMKSLREKEGSEVEDLKKKYQ